MNPRLPLSVLLPVLAFAALAGPVRAAASDRDRENKAKEYEALRLKYAASDAYNPYDDVVSDLRVQCSEQMFNKDYARAIEIAERGLKRDPYNIHLLMMEASAYRSSGNIAKADEVRAFWTGLVDSIFINDGDGYNTAYRVISQDEEDAVLRVLQLRPTDKRSVERRGSQYDIVSAENPKEGGRREIYFNVDLPKRWQARQAARHEAPPKPATAR